MSHATPSLSGPGAWSGPDRVSASASALSRPPSAAWGLHTVSTRGNFGFGILASVDGGETWRRSLAWEPEDHTAIQDLAVVPEPGDPASYTLWAATTEGVFRLRARVGETPGEEEGAPWQCVWGVAMATSVSPHPARPHEVLAACGSHGSPGHGIYLTTDGGVSWAKTRGVPKGLLGRIQLGRSTTRPDVVYATVDSQPPAVQSQAGTGGGEGSRPPGKTLGRFLSPLEPDPDPVNWLLAFEPESRRWHLHARTPFAGPQSWCSRHLAVDPRDPERVYLGGVSSLLPFRFSRAFGRSGGVYRIVTEQTGVVFAADVHQVAMHPTEPEVVYFASDQGVFKSLDAGRSFLPRNQQDRLWA